MIRRAAPSAAGAARAKSPPNSSTSRQGRTTPHRPDRAAARGQALAGLGACSFAPARAWRAPATVAKSRNGALHARQDDGRPAAATPRRWRASSAPPPTTPTRACREQRRRSAPHVGRERSVELSLGYAAGESDPLARSLGCRAPRGRSLRRRRVRPLVDRRLSRLRSDDPAWGTVALPQMSLSPSRRRGGANQASTEMRTVSDVAPALGGRRASRRWLGACGRRSPCIEPPG